MRFDLSTPCNECPFRTDITFYLPPARVDDILGAIFEGERTFTCHKTRDQHCAGALVLYNAMEGWQAHKAFRMAALFGLWDPQTLDMDAPVFHSRLAMRAHMEELFRDKL